MYTPAFFLSVDWEILFGRVTLSRGLDVGDRELSSIWRRDSGVLVPTPTPILVLNRLVEEVRDESVNHLAIDPGVPPDNVEPPPVDRQPPPLIQKSVALTLPKTSNLSLGVPGGGSVPPKKMVPPLT